MLSKRKWLISACIGCHWTAAVGKKKMYCNKIIMSIQVVDRIVVDIQSHDIVMLDSLHVQQVSFAKRIM